MTEAAWLDKRSVLRALVERVEQDLNKLEQSQRNAQSAATHEESRPENDKDTRALESSYLARGQAKRVLELREELLSLKAIEWREFGTKTPLAVSALVELGSDAGAVVCLLLPAGAGNRVELAGQVVRIVTPASPLGRALLGRVCGDTMEVQTPQGMHEYEIVRVC